MRRRREDGREEPEDAAPPPISSNSSSFIRRRQGAVAKAETRAQVFGRNGLSHAFLSLIPSLALYSFPSFSNYFFLTTPNYLSHFFFHRAFD